MVTLGVLTGVLTLGVMVDRNLGFLSPESFGLAFGSVSLRRSAPGTGRAAAGAEHPGTSGSSQEGRYERGEQGILTNGAKGIATN